MTHPLPVRLTHWLNAAAILTMAASGFGIYNASPLFAFRFPAWMTLGGWLGGHIAWHLATMWLLVINGMAYLVWGTLSGHLARKFLPLSARAIAADLRAAFRFRLSHRPGRYNAVQKACYLAVLAVACLAVASGLALWKPVQIWWLAEAMGGYEAARYVHFAAISGILGFLAIHLTLVLLVPRCLPPMVTGGPAAADEEECP